MSTEAPVVARTPGPWCVDHLLAPTVHDIGGRLIANCQVPFRSREECDANARIVAMGPAMLEALKDAANAMSALVEIARLVSDQDFHLVALRAKELPAIVHRADAVIAKAEGRLRPRPSISPAKPRTVEERARDGKNDAEDVLDA